MTLTGLENEIEEKVVQLCGSERILPVAGVSERRGPG